MGGYRISPGVEQHHQAPCLGGMGQASFRTFPKV